MNTTPDHPDFTALALGEHIHGTPARPVLDALRTSVAARQEAEHLRAAAAQLSFVLKGQAPQRLDNKRRNAIFNADVAAVRARFAAEERAEEMEQFELSPPVVVTRRRPAWIFPSVAAAAVAVAAVAAMRLLPGNTGSVNTPPAVVKAEPAGPDSSILVSTHTPETSAPRSRVPGVQNVPAPTVAQQENTSPIPQEAVPSAPPKSPSVPLVQREHRNPHRPAAPEVIPAKPPFRNDPHDYASPPRIPLKGK